jgi:cytidylate kinase
MGVIIAIDGPAGSGKSSVSKEVARRLGFGYLDTGAAYRALAWAVAKGMVSRPTLESETFEGFDYSISLNPDEFWVKSYGVDITEAIRLPKIAESVSSVASVPAVRRFMKELTRALVAQSDLAGVVVEGRDITTVVAPDAPVRLLLTASEEIRLERRAKELSPEDLATLRKQVLERDKSDSKVVDFMKPAEGVDLVDTTNLDFEQSVQAVLSIIREQL